MVGVSLPVETVERAPAASQAPAAALVTVKALAEPGSPAVKSSLVNAVELVDSSVLSLGWEDKAQQHLPQFDGTGDFSNHEGADIYIRASQTPRFLEDWVGGYAQDSSLQRTTARASSAPRMTALQNRSRDVLLGNFNFTGMWTLSCLHPT